MIQPIGYFKLWRELMTKPIWLDSTPEQKTILITLLAMANFNGKEWEWQGKSYKAERGQFVTSLDSIVKNCGIGISIQNVRTSIERFERYGFLTNQSTNKNRLITIVNWGLYQQTDNELTSNLTGAQQAANKQLTTREEGKEGKKDNIKDIHELSKFKEDSTAYGIADYLLLKIQASNPNTKKPNMQSWAAYADKMVRIDNRSRKDIKMVIDFATTDPFWQSNILSTKKLRDKFDTLYIQATKPRTNNQGKSKLQKQIDECDEWLDESEE